MADNLKTTGKKTADGDYENPTPAAPAATPKPLAPAVTPTPDPIPLAPAETPTATPLSYIPQQSYAATDYPYWLGVVNQEQQSNALNPDRHTAFTNEEMLQKYAAAGIDPSGQFVYPSRGDQSSVNRDVATGTSGGDEFWLSDSDLAYVRYCQEMYAKATTPSEKTYWHNEAEKARARAGYSGGTDGSMYLSTMREIKPSDSEGVRGSSTTNTAGTSSDLKSLLDAWQQAAMQKSNGQIDYAVAKAVAELERALADAQPQFKEQAESVDRDARQAMDNSALYAEMRGDKGGIGQEQYNAIQNTRAQNHLAVQQAQTKLATDTQRQIADLRAQGEFEKANAALEITQNYLAQLVSLEQWAAEYNLSVAQFQASLQQWEAEYNLSMQQLQISQNQWQAEFDYTKQLNSKNQLASMGEALLSAGIPLTDEQLKAMGITGEQASQLLIQQQLAAAQQEASKGGKQELSISDVDLNSAYDYLYSSGLNADSKDDAIVAILSMQGITGNAAKQIAALYKELGYAQAERKSLEENPLEAPADPNGMNADYFRAEMSSIMSNLGQGNLSAVESRVNYVWPLLSEEQRKQLETTLGKYGIALG